MSLTKFFTLNPVEYSASAVLAEEVCRQMIARLEWINMQPKTIVEVGCKAGIGVRLLSQKYPQAEITGIDADDGMVAYAKTQVENVTFMQAEADILPFADQSVDLLVANLTLSFCQNIEAVLHEWRRVLRPEGLLMFTSLGPDTLEHWRETLAEVTVPNLIDMHHYGDALVKSKFLDPVMDVDYVALRYRSAEKFLSELMASGMIVTSNSRIEAANEYIAEYEIVFGHAWAPHVSAEHVADEFGVVKIPLAHLRRRAI